MPVSIALSPASPAPRRFVCCWCADSARAAPERAIAENYGICAPCLDVALARLKSSRPVRRVPRRASPAAGVALRAAR